VFRLSAESRSRSKYSWAAGVGLLLIGNRARIAGVQTTCAAFLRHAVAWYADHGTHVERVLSDNAKAYHSRTWADTCAELGVRRRYTRPCTPRTNVEDHTTRWKDDHPSAASDTSVSAHLAQRLVLSTRSRRRGNERLRTP
jgi:hypothetical protein